MCLCVCVCYITQPRAMKHTASLCCVLYDLYYRASSVRSDQVSFTFVHFCSGLTQRNGRCRINEIAILPVSLRLDCFVSLVSSFGRTLDSCTNRVEEIIRRLILRFSSFSACDR